MQHRQDQILGARLQTGLAQSGRALMAWTSSGDTRQQVRLRFDSKEEVIAYCEQNGIPYRAFEPNPPKLQIQNYAANFA
jgi:hypothetical protein